MSNYLLKSDFERFITLTNLDGITDATDPIWEIELLSTIEVVSSYLRFRYDTDKEFKPIEPHVPANTYLIGDRVIDGTDLYFAIQDVPAATLLTDILFWTKADSRNPAIVQIVVVLILYNIYSRINGSEIPTWIQVMYDGGDSQQRGGKLGYLKDIRKGTVQINLALLPEVEDGTDQSGNNIAFGSAIVAVNRNTSI
ncbi:MAG: hypothetical protein QQN55_08185 [Nitrosopumilus sp.]